MISRKRIAEITVINALFLIAFSALKLWEQGAFEQGRGVQTTSDLLSVAPLIAFFVFFTLFRVYWESKVAQAQDADEREQLEAQRKKLIAFGVVAGIVLLTIVFMWQPEVSAMRPY
ncbi:hypothetical protein [Trueperella sp.]|uniref:hypothetical protein n=1 Tax=Trueperella sp. TaxID=2699835 RepID=UPI0037356338